VSFPKEKEGSRRKWKRILRSQRWKIFRAGGNGREFSKKSVRTLLRKFFEEDSVRLQAKIEADKVVPLDAGEKKIGPATGDFFLLGVFKINKLHQFSENDQGVLGLTVLSKIKKTKPFQNISQNKSKISAGARYLGSEGLRSHNS